MNSLPAAVKVDEQYLEVARYHVLMLGFAASLFACAVNIFLRLSPLSVLATLSAVSALWFTWFNAAEPGFIEYVAGALADFLLWLLAAAAPVSALFWLIDRKLRTGKDPGNDQDSGKAKELYS